MNYSLFKVIWKHNQKEITSTSGSPGFAITNTAYSSECIIKPFLKELVGIYTVDIKNAMDHATAFVDVNVAG